MVQHSVGCVKSTRLVHRWRCAALLSTLRNALVTEHERTHQRRAETHAARCEAFQHEINQLAEEIERKQAAISAAEGALQRGEAERMISEMEASPFP